MEKPHFPSRASATISKRLVFVLCGAMCAWGSETSRRSRTVFVADESVDHPGLFFGFALGMSGVGVDVGVGVAVGVRVGAGGEMGMMAAIGITVGSGAAVRMELVFIAQVWGVGSFELQWRLRR